MSHYMAKDVRTAIGAAADLCKNRSLFISKFPDISEDGSDKEAKKRSIGRLVKINAADQGIEIRNSFPVSLRKSGCPCASIMARLKARMIINQAGGVIENAGLCIDPHFGLPFIPGSALKGVARAAARHAGGQPGEILAVFGWSAGDRQLPDKIQGESYIGSVAFLPSYPIGDAALSIDIVTCHYPDYYRDPEKKASMDNEAPVPNPFPVIESDATFSFTLALIATQSRLDVVKNALGLPADFDPLAKASHWLEYGLTELGVGAKTSAGYGWFIRDHAAEKEELNRENALEEKEREKERRKAEEQERQLAEARRLAALSPTERCREQLLCLADEEFANFARTLTEKSTGEQRAFLQLLRQEKRDRWRTWKKRKPQLAEAIQSVAGSLGEVLP